jgi:hypothetical protein
VRDVEQEAQCPSLIESLAVVPRFHSVRYVALTAGPWQDTTLVANAPSVGCGGAGSGHGGRGDGMGQAGGGGPQNAQARSGHQGEVIAVGCTCAVVCGLGETMS